MSVRYSLAHRTPCCVSLVTFCVLAVLVASVQPLAAADAAARKPNILFILVDDMGWSDLGCYGNAFNETPVIDRLASQGMRFTDFYAATPVCSSTRSTIQTGQYSARTGITDFIPGHWRPFEKLVVPPIDHQLKDGIRTPGNVLKDAGYVTGYFGKWHLGSDAAHQPDRHGYDITEKQLGKEFNTWRGEHGTQGRGPKSVDFLTDATIYFIEQNRDKPFFVTLAHHSVHIPIEARGETVKKYEARPKPNDRVNNPKYAGMVEDLDTATGRILKTLDDLHLADNTIVVFTSDNGGLNKTFTGLGGEVTTNYPLRDEKGTVYEGGIRVPMIVRWPPGIGTLSAGVAPGSVCDEPTTTADLMLTFCDMAGATPPKQAIDGLSMIPLLRDAGATLPRDAIYFHYPHYHHSRPAGAIRMGDYKLIEFFDGTGLELYSLKDDIGESKNLAASLPDRSKSMQAKLAAWRDSVGARMPTPNPKYDPARAAEWQKRGSNKPIKAEVGRRAPETTK